jgi:hypothetical protein
LEKPDEPLCAGTHGPEKTKIFSFYLFNKKYFNTDSKIPVNRSERFVGRCGFSSMANYERMGEWV